MRLKKKWNINRKVFFDNYRKRFGSLVQEQVDSIEYLLGLFELEEELNSNAVAYILATVKHETANTFLPIHEIGTATYFNRRYGPNTAVGKRLGNVNAGDGAKYAGRGYVQLTGRDNYEKMGKLLDVGLLEDPDMAMRPAIAYQIMMIGMQDGIFTGKKLHDYFFADICDFVGARRIINGTDKAHEIAEIAKGLVKGLNIHYA
jgi:predicted chitinase